jgi:hypothetical protein
MADYANYYDYLTGSGVIVPDTSTILSDVQNEWKEIFGQNLSVEPETPQGRIIEMIARQRVFSLQIAASISNMLNIDKGYGFILDDLGSVFQIQRKSATYTTTQITMSGVADTVIPAGTQLRSDEGYLFVNDNEYVIGSNGSTTGIFRAMDSGIIPAEVGTITTIVTAVAGLESVVNNANATIGTEQESDQSFRERIKASLNINSMAVLSAIKSSVANIEGVIQVQAYENPTSTASILNTVFKIPPHGVGIIVDYQETDLTTQPVAYAIAEAIYKKKTLGAAYITNQTEEGEAYLKNVAYTDEYDNESHNVVFATPIPHNVACTVNVRKKFYTGDDLESAVKDAIAEFLAGNNPEVDRVNIGETLSPFEIASAISSAIPDIFITSVLIGNVGSTQTTDNIQLGDAEKLVIAPENITVNISD